MKSKSFINTLVSHKNVFRNLFIVDKGFDVRWKSEPGKWSLLEIVNHLWDEEKDDFRTRLRLTLSQKGEDWPPIDPEGWVRERDYNNRDYLESVKGFLSEREKSIKWLRGLENPDWDVFSEHPVMGKIRAGDLFSAWVAHDVYHMRQITNWKIVAIETAAEPFTTRYAKP